MPPKQPMGPSSVAHLASKLLLSDALSAVFRHNYLSSPLSINIINPPVPPGMTRNSPLFQEMVQNPSVNGPFHTKHPVSQSYPSKALYVHGHTHTHMKVHTHRT